MAIEFLQLGTGDVSTFAGQLSAWHGGRGLRADLAEWESRRLLSDDHAWHVWLIRSGGRAVGYLVLEFRSPGFPVPPRGTVAALYLEPGARGRGIGHRAHRFVHEIGRWLQVAILGGDNPREDRPLAWAAPRQRLGDWRESGEWRAIA